MSVERLESQMPEENDMNDDIQCEILRRSAELRGNPKLAELIDQNYFERMKRKTKCPL
jgi:hypothetical protein